MTSAATQTERPTCSCGHDRYHHYARPDISYSAIGTALVMMQIMSPVPTHIAFTCGKCGELFETTKDRAVCAAFKYFPDIYEKP